MYSWSPPKFFVIFLWSKYSHTCKISLTLIYTCTGLVSCITTDIHLRLHSFLIRLTRRFLQPRACGGGLTRWGTATLWLAWRLTLFFCRFLRVRLLIWLDRIDRIKINGRELDDDGAFPRGVGTRMTTHRCQCSQVRSPAGSLIVRNKVLL